MGGMKEREDSTNFGLMNLMNLGATCQDGEDLGYSKSFAGTGRRHSGRWKLVTLV